MKMNPEPKKEELARMDALQQKRTLAFINHCVMMNVQCFNNFMQNCEEKLMLFERQLDRVEAAMVLLESKLLSVPEVNTIMAEAAPVELLEPIHENPPQTDTNATTQNMEVTTDSAQDIPEMDLPSPKYNRFVKMVRVGVPLQAAKLKCALEGLDPDILAELLDM